MATGTELLQQLIAQDNPYSIGQKVTNAFNYQQRPGDSLGKMLGIGAGKMALGGLLDNLANRRADRNAVMTNTILPSLISDPLGTSNPGMSSEVFLPMQGHYIEEAQSRAMEEALRQQKREENVTDQTMIELQKAKLAEGMKIPSVRARLLEDLLMGSKTESPSATTTEPGIGEKQALTPSQYSARKTKVESTAVKSPEEYGALAERYAQAGLDPSLINDQMAQDREIAKEERVKVEEDRKKLEAAKELGIKIMQAQKVIEGSGATGGIFHQPREVASKLLASIPALPGSYDQQIKRSMQTKMESLQSDMGVAASKALAGAIAEKEMALLLKQGISPENTPLENAAILNQLNDRVGATLGVKPTDLAAEAIKALQQQASPQVSIETLRADPQAQAIARKLLLEMTGGQ